MVIEITSEEQAILEEKAHERGYANVKTYLFALVTADTLGDELTEEDSVDRSDELREAWHEAMTGKVRPVSELWDELDADER